MKPCAGRVDELRHFFLAENRGQTMSFLRIGSIRDAPRPFEFPWACGPPIDMKIGLGLCCILMARGRRRSVYALDEVRPFLSLIGNARFEPIYVAPPSE